MPKKKKPVDPMTEQDPNPVNKDEKEREKTTQPRREDPGKAQQSDTDFSPEEKKEIVQMVMEDYQTGVAAYADWKTKKEKDLQHIHAEKPSIIESLTKKEWQSDRNLGLLPGTLDIYQATLMSTCWNPDTIHFTSTEENDIDNRDNLEKFAKWAVGPKEMNLDGEVDDFIANRVSLGFSAFKIDWEIRYEWVDKRIPVWSKTGRKRVIKYDIKTEKRRFERGRIRNIDDIDKLILPSYGKSFKDLPFVIEVIPVMLSDVRDMEARKLIVTKITDKLKEKKKDAPPKLAGAPMQAANQDSFQRTKAEFEGISLTVDPEGRDFPMDVFEWYGWIRRKGRRERYRIQVEPTTETFMSGKPLRCLNRQGRVPYVGGALRRVPGQIRGGSLTSLVAPIINALNNNYNQTSDYQTIQNLPFGFANFDEGFTETLYEVDPGKIYSIDGNPAEAVYFPNLQRSLAWSYQDKQFLLEMIERLTGAASYFLTSQSQQATATRDNIVEQKGETKFGIWVRRIQNDITEAINMAVSLYQDWAPPGLGKRVLGKDGKQIIRNLSIDTLRGNYDGEMSPDLTAGSKAYEKQIYMWATESAQQNCIWLSAQFNPRGNWLLWKETFIKQGFQNPEHFMPPQPKQGMDDNEEAKNEWQRFMQGEMIDPDEVEGITPGVVGHYMTHMKDYETKFQDLDEEYRENFKDHVFKTKVNFDKFLQQVARQQQEMQIASQGVQLLERLGLKPNAGPAQQPAPVQPPPAVPGQPPLPGAEGGLVQ